jgi:hypothetical protein
MKQTLNVKIDLSKYGYNRKYGPKWVLIVWPKIPQNLSAQFARKLSMKKGLRPVPLLT